MATHMIMYPNAVAIAGVELIGPGALDGKHVVRIDWHADEDGLIFSTMLAPTTLPIIISQLLSIQQEMESEATDELPLL